MQVIARAKKFYTRYERYLLPASFAAGFVWDNLTLKRIDLVFENFVFAWNLLVAAFAIALMNGYEAGRVRGRLADRVVPFLPLFLQFAFGGLFSAFLVFYARSGSLAASWPFFLFLAVLFAGNEFFRKRYLRLTFQMSIFFIALFSYSVFILPVVFGKMGALMFVASGAVALFVIGLILLGFYRFMPERIEQNRKALAWSIAGIYVAFHILYFANIIPPIPLALKESGIYHSIERTNAEGYLYEVSFEPAPRYLFFKEASDTFHWKQGVPIYSYSAVFAPTRLNTTILHRWLFYDEAKNEWVGQGRIEFPIVGGRDGGYRGYTFKQGIRPGKWRVDVITARGQVLGRRTFTVVQTDILPPLQTAFR